MNAVEFVIHLIRDGGKVLAFSKTFVVPELFMKRFFEGQQFEIETDVGCFTTKKHEDSDTDLFWLDPPRWMVHMEAKAFDDDSDTDLLLDMLGKGWFPVGTPKPSSVDLFSGKYTKSSIERFRAAVRSLPEEDVAEFMLDLEDEFRRAENDGEVEDDT